MDSSESHRTEKRDEVSIAHSAPVLNESRPGAEVIDGAKERIYLHGLRFVAMSIATAATLFLSTVDITITTTAIVAITRDIGGFGQSSWILSAYSLGMVAVLVVAAKLSDLFGRKSVFVGGIAVFAVFSGGCAAAQNITQLIVLRALQGVGGGVCFSLTMVLILEAVPPKDLSSYASKINMALVMGLVLGPVLGGAISSHTSWRWIFHINPPVCALVIVLVLLSVPDGYPYKEQANAVAGSKITMLKRVDVPGVVLVPLATLTFTAAFQEAESRFSWRSAYFITLLTASIVLWVVLLFWERRVTLLNDAVEPIMPWRMFTNRLRAALMINFMLIGAPVAVTNFQLPQRFQLINGLSSIDAGVRIVPFGAAFTVGSFCSTQASIRMRLPSIYHAFIGSALQIIGYALLSQLTAARTVQEAVYGYEVLSGFGVGLSFMAFYVLVPFTTDERDQSIAAGLVAQVRMMGTAIGLGIITAVFNGYTKSRLSGLGIPTNISHLGALLTTNDSSLSPHLIAEARDAVSEGYNRQMLVLCAFAAVQFIAALLLWKRKQIVAA